MILQRVTMLMIGLGLTTPNLQTAAFNASAKGTTAASFLKLGVGSRAVGMGEAYTALVNEASALYWNPACLPFAGKRSAMLMHAIYVESSFFDYLGYVQQIGQHKAFALGVQYVSAGSIESTNEAGVDMGRLSPHDLALSAGYGWAWKRTAIGASGKFIQSKISQSASAYAMDYGMLFSAAKRIRLGFSISNLGTSMKFHEKAEKLPVLIRLGTGIALSKNMVMGVDVVAPSDNHPYGAIGFDYNIGRVAIRTGYNSRTIKEHGGLSGVSLGLGLNVGAMRFDYAFVPIGSLGFTNRISMTIKL